MQNGLLKKQVIEFQGNEYLLIGTMENGGAIATEHQYENFLPSFGHLKKDGSIWSHGRIIGSRHDIKIRGEFTGDV